MSGKLMPERLKAVVIAGPASGVGKTTVTLAIMAALRARGLTLQPFKCGPDYIDPGHHTRVCGRASRNLDGWMLPEEVNRGIFAAHAGKADVSIVEGVMGLFDGARDSGAGSTAAMAKCLNLPVVLVVDASKMAASAAALVRGFQTFDPAVHVAGVVMNRVGGAGHYELLRQALATAGCPPALGYLPDDPAIQIPERHLGLHTAEEDGLGQARLEHLSEVAGRCLDLDRLLGIAVTESALTGAPPQPVQPAPDVRIAVARDRAFCFYYEDNLDALRRAGAAIVPFSPLEDPCLPAGVDAVYFGGGYPELHARQLSANETMLASVRAFAARGLPVYAECGGLMYLSRELRVQDGTGWKMAGVLPVTIAMTERLVQFGYTEVRLTADCMLGRPGTIARGHSFHYSNIVDRDSGLDCVYQTRRPHSGVEGVEGYAVHNVLASYVHLHFLSNPILAETLIESARARGGIRSHG